MAIELDVVTASLALDLLTLEENRPVQPGPGAPRSVDEAWGQIHADWFMRRDSLRAVLGERLVNLVLEVRREEEESLRYEQAQRIKEELDGLRERR